MIWQSLQRTAFIIFLTLVVVSIVAYAVFGADFNLSDVREYLRYFGVWAPVVFIIFYTLGTIFIPSTPFMAIAGVLFGFKYGLLYTIIGGLLSLIITFTIARKLGKDRVESVLQNKYLKPLNKYNSRLESGGFWDLIILRIVPIMPFNVLNILLGVSKISVRNYILGSIIGLIPSNILTVYFGNLITKIL
jgi:uncharacterized membrane protein YdjX (TVP38/TMEM64 family)